MLRRKGYEVSEKIIFLNIKYGPIQLIIQFFELSAIKKNL